jgi:hypothetical protein
MEKILSNLDNNNNNINNNNIDRENRQQINENNENNKNEKNENESNFNLSIKSLIRMREVYVINNLKKQINTMKNSLRKKDEEIEEFKKNIKSAKYSKLEFNYNTNLNSYAKIKLENENVRKLCTEITEKFIKEKEENEKIGDLFIKQKSYLDEIKQKMKYLEEENKELNKKSNIMEDKINFLNTYATPPAASFNHKMIIKKQDKILINYKEELENLNENFNKEKIRLDKRILYMDKDFKELKKCYEYFYLILYFLFLFSYSY